MALTRRLLSLGRRSLAHRSRVAELLRFSDDRVGDGVIERRSGCRVGRRAAHGAGLAFDELRPELSGTAGEPTPEEVGDRRARGVVIADRGETVGLGELEDAGERLRVAGRGEPQCDDLARRFARPEVRGEVARRSQLLFESRERLGNPCPQGVELGDGSRAPHDLGAVMVDRPVELGELLLAGCGQRPDSQVSGQVADRRAQTHGIPLAVRLERGPRIARRPLLSEAGREGGVRPTGRLHRRPQRFGGVGPREKLPSFLDFRLSTLERGQRRSRRRTAILALPEPARLGVRRLSPQVSDGRGIPLPAQRLGAIVGALQPALRSLDPCGDAGNRLLRRTTAGLADRGGIGDGAQELMLGENSLSLREQHLDEGAGRGERLLGVLAPIVERRLVALVRSRAEESAQQLLPIVAAREEELGEPVLREQDHLQELLLVQAEQLVDLVTHVDRPRGAPDPLAADPLEQLGAVRLFRSADAPALRTLVLRRAHETQASARGA